MRRSTLRTAVAVVTAGLTLTACGSDDGGSAGAAGRTDAATATSAEDFGGMDALIEAAQEEGTLNVIALPPDWANYGEMLDTFSEKYDIEINSASPDGSSQDELNAVDQPAGPGPRPRRPRPRHQPSPGRPQAQDLLAPVPGRDLGRDPRGPEGPRRPLVQRLRRLHLHRLQRVGDRRVPDDDSQDLLDPQYAGQVALNGNPTQAAAAFSGVWAASLANGGSLDDIGPGIDFFAEIKDAGNFNPVEITPATIQSGETPLAIDWDYLNAAFTETFAEAGRRVGGQRPERRAVRRLLQPGDQQVRPAPGGGAALAGVPLQRRGPEHLAEGRRPAGPAAGDGGGRHRRRRRARGAARRSRARRSSRPQEQETAAQQVVARTLERGDLRLSTATPATAGPRRLLADEGPARPRAVVARRAAVLPLRRGLPAAAHRRARGGGVPGDRPGDLRGDLVDRLDRGDHRRPLPAGLRRQPPAVGDHRGARRRARSGARRRGAARPAGSAAAPPGAHRLRRAGQLRRHPAGLRLPRHDRQRRRGHGAAAPTPSGSGSAASRCTR